MCFCLRLHENRKRTRRVNRCRVSPVPLADDACKQPPPLIAPSWTDDHESTKDRHAENVRHVSTDGARATPASRASRDHGGHELERVHRRHARQGITAPRGCPCPNRCARRRPHRAGCLPADVYAGRCSRQLPYARRQHDVATNSGDGSCCSCAAHAAGATRTGKSPTANAANTDKWPTDPT